MTDSPPDSHPGRPAPDDSAAPERPWLGDILAALAPGPSGCRVPVPPNWSQGRAGFGGLVTALCVEAIRRETGEAAPLRSLTMAFIGPALGEIDIQVRPLRRGRTASFIEATVVTGGGQEVAASLTACFGPERESRLTLESPRRASLPDPAAGMRLPPLRGMGPVFLGQFDVRVVRGVPFGGGAEAEIEWWTRHHDPAARTSEAGLIAALDVLPPAASARLRGLVPVASLTWFIDFPGGLPAAGPAPAVLPVATGADPAGEDAGPGWVLTRSSADHGGGGFSGQAMASWSADGRLLALHRQSVGIFG
ncbi:thioesterase family protein [Rhodocista pekingensis]|uniref:Thioesterase family protein n=1 Tax=Rhodocista pekingensis TaxID=201185 RepID=A0ABW2KRT5_9PROT